MFKQGDTVIFEPANFNPEFWNGLKNHEKVKYYGNFYHLQYDLSIDLSHSIKLPSIYTAIEIECCKQKLFTYICEHNPQNGHCVLMDMDTGELFPMCHTSNFRLATDDEC